VTSQQQAAADAALRRQLAQEHPYRSSETPGQAQANNGDTPTQRELDERWSYYYQSTRVPPAELKARMQAQARSSFSTQPPA
jgi:fructosamine-3-kinase